ncbi:hypothetical protein JL978_05180 [Acinetobacter baumannii]|uniref:hypothetical protein n=1 Tax=Acinetobacter baumannii TaxID=470 RepID=UPI001C47F475|nr:hypothetical protein [Acinetobacter baumannii]MBV6572821.1 hypothetical protein [Acinetobacter baumannii]MBV6576428.1 hypothetical protein [Acinetobacter baumannii]
MSKPIPKEMILDELLGQFRNLARYWAQHQGTDIEKCEGLVHSILTIFDGRGCFPAIDLVIRPHPDVKQYHIDNGDDYIVDGTIINDDVILNDLFFSKAESKEG